MATRKGLRSVRRVSPPVRRAATACGGLLLPVTLLGLIAGSTGCESNHEDLKVFLRADEHKVSATDYRLTPPDVLLISAPGAPEIDGDQQMVRVDGMISLRLLGEVRVVGLTPEEVSAKLEDMLRRYYHDPQVHVRVGGYNSKRFYILGEVGGAGPQPYTGRDTLMDALARCQPNNLAWKENIKVIRPSPDASKKHTITVNVAKMTESGDMKMNVLLQEGDIVYVPPTPLAWMGLRLREIVWPMEEASNLYSIPQNFMETTDYYRDHRDSRSKDDGEQYRSWRSILGTR
jgi:protein involved in polysaccharide export with SLBB domain